MYMSQSSKQGVLLAVSAYGFWAIAPVYFKWIKHINPFEILAHRVIWSLLLTLLILLFLRKIPQLFEAIKNKKTRLYLLASTILIGFNWGVFIWAINNDQMLSASLGYYINPLVNIMLGMIFFADRLDGIKKIAASLCIFAVAFELYQFGQVPWIALGLASSFGLYGLVRKKLAVDSFIGMALETLLLMPVAIGYLMLANSGTNNIFANDMTLNAQLFLAGPVTMIPLLCFAAAANRLTLTSLGFFQYIGPTGMFLLAVFVYNEPISVQKLTTFTIIWLALALIIWGNVRSLLKNR
jgi:chloramphenicol-sensitive protein RarD